MSDSAHETAVPGTGAHSETGQNEVTHRLRQRLLDFAYIAFAIAVLLTLTLMIGWAVSFSIGANDAQHAPATPAGGAAPDHAPPAPVAPAH